MLFEKKAFIIKFLMLILEHYHTLYSINSLVSIGLSNLLKSKYKFTLQNSNSVYLIYYAF